MVAHVYYINGCLTKFTPGGVIIPFSPDKFNSADAMLRGLLQFCNTTEPDSGLSSAMVLLGRALRDTLPFKPTESAFSPSSPVSDDWKGYWAE